MGGVAGKIMVIGANRDNRLQIPLLLICTMYMNSITAKQKQLRFHTLNQPFICLVCTQFVRA